MRKPRKSDIHSYRRLNGRCVSVVNNRNRAKLGDEKQLQPTAYGNYSIGCIGSPFACGLLFFLNFRNAILHSS